MSYYLAAYDTEGVFPWWDKNRRQRGFSYTPEHITEFLNGVRAVADVHLERNVPASFFLVAKMLELCGPELRAILDHPLFDIQCHSFTHPNLIALGDDRATLQYELGDAKKLIEDTFGREVTGLTAPGGYTDGFRGQHPALEVMWESGYRYVRSVGLGPKGTMPALMDQPFWYAEDGFPELLETPSHAWHDNVLTGQPATVHWPPLLPWPYPTAMPRDAQGVYEAYAPGIDYCAQAGASLLHAHLSPLVHLSDRQPGRPNRNAARPCPPEAGVQVLQPDLSAHPPASRACLNRALLLLL